ncbi:alanine--tRNA ligase [Candidatus Parcubacteria bacterium]|nr:MAG: alanine--tRNA ligase [Candidatus Parcubacteria bacterium]
MSVQDIRQIFLSFFAKRDHVVVPSSSLIPDDPSVLFTTAGMQQFKPYFVGKADAVKDFGSPNTASVQKCFRTSDIDAVGDESHLTFFEMLGNFSFGGYFKEQAIHYAYEFLVQKLGLHIDYVSIFQGDDEVPRDTESERIWKSLGVGTIRTYGREDNFWGPTGAEGPCGPTTEIFVRVGEEAVEVWNLVFNQYYCARDGTLSPLPQPGVDTGMGLERLAMVVEKRDSVFATDLFAPLIAALPSDLAASKRRILADHARAAVFLVADGIRPSNKEQGYVLRRLLRRIIAFEIPESVHLFSLVKENYGQFYPEIVTAPVEEVFEEERAKFTSALRRGERELQKRFQRGGHYSYEELGRVGFDVYQSYGVPVEVYLDTLRKLSIPFEDTKLRAAYEEAFHEHQRISRAGKEKKFGGHGLVLDTGELKAGDREELAKVVRLHTATHLLQQALRDVLGPEVQQRGSDITAERTRFDFSFPRKLTEEEKRKVEEIVNQKIRENLPVNYVELPIEEAKRTGALYFFREKYPPVVKVYYVGRSLEDAYSKEFCGGPHVRATGEIGGIRILKEESVGAGVRRIRAALV